MYIFTDNYKVEVQIYGGYVYVAYIVINVLVQFYFIFKDSLKNYKI